MDHTNGPRLLAIAVDAAEPTFVQQLIERADMPALGSLLNAGKWLRVKSPADIASASVWPTFISGESPKAHGFYGEWLWDASTMSLSRWDGGNISPFWKELLEQGVSVGVLDVPFMPLLGVSNGFEISEWGAHDVVAARTRLAPDSIASIVGEHSPHPLEARFEVSGPEDYAGLERVGDICLRGITARGNLSRALIAETKPQLALLGFTEIHHASHYLWHKVEPEHPAYSDSALNQLATTRPDMREIYKELDKQIGELVSVVGTETSVMVFSLHGMRPARGSPAFLAPWLCERGFARFKNWRNQSWSERAKSSFATLKRHAPASAKKLYYRAMPANVTFQLASPTMLPRYDWANTTAFSLPTDQHGWIRVNLMGREAQGIVPPGSYDDICQQLESDLRGLRSQRGEVLVHDVIRTALHVDSAMSQRLPDIVVHWTDEVFAAPLVIAGSKVKAESIGKKYVGQHSLEGFCILRSAQEIDSDHLCAQDMHILFNRLLHPLSLSAGTF